MRKGDVVVCHYTEEMETMVCRDCFRPFCVGIHYVNQQRGSWLYCPAGHHVDVPVTTPVAVTRKKAG